MYTGLQQSSIENFSSNTITMYNTQLQQLILSSFPEY